MEAYCKEVQRLKDKFHGLELIHIARRYNEAADELAKIARLEARSRPTRSRGICTNHRSTWARGLTSRPPPSDKLTPSTPCW